MPHCPSRDWDEHCRATDPEQAVEPETPEMLEALRHEWEESNRAAEEFNALENAVCPTMTQREGAILAVKVMDLLAEVENALQCLQVTHSNQHHDDLYRRVDPVWRALDPILANGLDCVERLARNG